MTDALSQPRAPKQPCPDHKVKPRNSKKTLREFFTEDETNTKLIGVLKNLALTYKNGPWKDHFEFYVANQSGDVGSFSPEVKKKAEKMLKDVKAKYAEMQKSDTE